MTDFGTTDEAIVEDQGTRGALKSGMTEGATEPATMWIESIISVGKVTRKPGLNCWS
jgi:hypothetical protein